MRCSAYRLDPGRCNSGLRQERVWRAQRPGAENRRYRDLRARQRPHAPRLNRGKARKSGPIRQTLGHFGSYGSGLKLRARHAVLSNEALEQPGTEFRGATDKRAPPRARPSTRKHARSPTNQRLQPLQRGDPRAAIRLAPYRSKPLVQTSIRGLPGSAPPPAPSQRTGKSARFLGPPPRARRRFDRTTGATDKRLLRSGGLCVVELYNEVHPHKALGYRSPREFIAAHKTS